MECQFTCQLIEAPPRAPTLHTAFGKGIERRSHPAEDRAELFVFFLIQESALEIDDEKLSHYLSFTSQRKCDHDEHDEESRNHYDDVSEYENTAAAEHGRTVPDAVHEDRHQQADDRSQHFDCDIGGLSCEA